MPLAARVVAEMVNAAFALDDGCLAVVAELEKDAVLVVTATVGMPELVDPLIVGHQPDLA